MVISEGSHSQFDIALIEVSFFQANRHKDFTGSVDKVCGYYYKYIYIYIFFWVGQILDGDTGLTQSPLLLPDHALSLFLFNLHRMNFD